MTTCEDVNCYVQSIRTSAWHRVTSFYLELLLLLIITLSLWTRHHVKCFTNFDLIRTEKPYDTFVSNLETNRFGSET